MHAGAEADMVAAAGDQLGPFYLVEHTRQIRLPGHHRVHAARVEHRYEARRPHVDSAVFSLGDPAFGENGPKVEIAGRAECGADFLALQVGDGFNSPAGPDGDSDHLVRGGLREGCAYVADDAANLDAALEGGGQVGESGRCEVDLARLEGLGELGARVADRDLRVDAMLGEDAPVHAGEYDHAAVVAGRAEPERWGGGGGASGHEAQRQGDGQ